MGGNLYHSRSGEYFYLPEDGVARPEDPPDGGATLTSGKINTQVPRPIVYCYTLVE